MCRRVWLDTFLCWTSDRTARIAITTCGEDSIARTAIQVFDGCVCPSNETLLACAADEGCAHQARVSVDVVDGHTYMIRVGEDYNESTGGFVTVRIYNDRDGDFVRDSDDNCPDVANPDQADANGNGVGDGCDQEDSDDDGVPDAEDNCPNVANADQADADHDGIGDVCEPDSDGDGTIDDLDGCPDDPDKTEPGACGCGHPDTDADHNGTPDCNESSTPQLLTLRVTCRVGSASVTATVYIWTGACPGSGDPHCQGTSDKTTHIFECSGFAPGGMVCVYGFGPDEQSATQSVELTDPDHDGIIEVTLDLQ